MTTSSILGLYILVVLGDIGVSATCPEGFERHGDRCYKVLEIPSSWAEAKVYCSVFGGDLAAIDDANEHAIMKGIIERLHGSTIDVRYWIDGSDILAENEWRWMGQKGGSTPMSYTNWYPGMPDNAGDSEDCLELANGYHGQYNDRPCESNHGFICEASVHDGNLEIVG